MDKYDKKLAQQQAQLQHLQVELWELIESFGDELTQLEASIVGQLEAGLDCLIDAGDYLIAQQWAARQDRLSVHGEREMLAHVSKARKAIKGE